MTATTRADWMVNPQRVDGRPLQPLIDVECATCRERSDTTDCQGAAEAWAIEHTMQTGHRRYRENHAEFIQVTPSPVSPLYAWDEACR